MNGTNAEMQASWRSFSGLFPSMYRNPSLLLGKEKHGHVHGIDFPEAQGCIIAGFPRGRQQTEYCVHF